MAHTLCKVCGFQYDEWAGDSKNGVPPGTPMFQLAGTLCSTCGLQGIRHERQPNPSYQGMEAHYYDQFAGKAGIAFYRDWIRETVQEGSVLELGVGTGRIALELCRKGISVVGVDSSPEMLSQAEKKRNRMSLSSDQLELVEQDAKDLNLGRTFSHVLLADGFLQHFTLMEEQRKLLQSIHEHLKPGGAVAIDLMLPPCESNWKQTQQKRVTPDSTVYQVVEGETSLSRQLFRYTATYEVFEQGMQLSRYRVQREMALMLPREAGLLLSSEGFEVVQMVENYALHQPSWKTSYLDGLEPKGAELGLKESLAKCSDPYVKTYREDAWSYGGYPFSFYQGSPSSRLTILARRRG